MNKGRRNEIEKLKWEKRLKNLGIPLEDKEKFTCYKSQGKPCSCNMCSSEKYDRNIKHKGRDQE